MAASDEEFPSKNAVRKASRVLRETHDAASRDSRELNESFRIAHAWRDAHLIPMRKLRASAAAHARLVDSRIITAGRVKRMRSIRKKLHRSQINLVDVQDLGGCRAIVPTVEECRILAERFLEASGHTLKGRTNYIGQPRASGYRSDHLIFRFEDSSDPRSNGRLIELQVRSRLQHAWATAVEAVGLVRGEDLKGGEGSADWLRFFALMSGEIAADEGTAPIPAVPALENERRSELNEINARLDAVSALDSYRRAISAASVMSATRGGMFLIQYDPDARTVHVERTGAALGQNYATAEQKDRAIETVLVDVDGAQDLQIAFPNYYLDVEAFLRMVKRATVRAPGKWRPDFSSILGRAR